MAETRVVADPSLVRPSLSRPFQIIIDGRAYFVEASYGRRHRQAEAAALYFIALGAAGLLYAARREASDRIK